MLGSLVKILTAFLVGVNVATGFVKPLYISHAGKRKLIPMRMVVDSSLSSLLNPNLAAPLLLTGSVVLAALDVKKIQSQSDTVMSYLKQIEIKAKKGLNADVEVGKCEEAQARISSLTHSLSNRFNLALSALLMVWGAAYLFR